MSIVALTANIDQVAYIMNDLITRSAWNRSAEQHYGSGEEGILYGKKLEPSKRK